MARIPMCMCNDCNNVGKNPVSIAKRGGRLGYMCDFHFAHLEDYSKKNEFRLGNEKQNGFTFSIELETNYSAVHARGELLNHGFLPTDDPTLGRTGVEYKSPIYEGLNAVSKQCVSIETMLNNGELEMDWHCGTHFHVGHHDYINAETMEMIREYFIQLFKPLSDAIASQSEDECAAFWGREMSGWAEPIDEHTHPLEHCNFINLQHKETIEFRLPRFINAAQYMRVVKFCRDIVNAVINNFILHYNDIDFDRKRYPTADAYRQHKAKVTANKLLALYEKYLNA